MGDMSVSSCVYVPYETSVVMCHRECCSRQLAVDSNLDLTRRSLDEVAETVVLFTLEPSMVIPLARIVDDFCETHLWTLALRYNKLHFLLWLHGRGFDFKGLVAQAAITAAENDYVALLNWLYSISEAAVWTDKLLQELMWEAGRYNSYNAMEWLREKAYAFKHLRLDSIPHTMLGGAWPDSIYKCTALYDAHFHECWPVYAIQWALERGSTWLNWKCSQLAPKHYRCCSQDKSLSNAEHNDDECYDDMCEKGLAGEVFTWAHSNGCPCTCVQERGSTSSSRP
eukprot:2745-Heterococcus_DN1.PRE.2